MNINRCLELALQNIRFTAGQEGSDAEVRIAAMDACIAAAEACKGDIRAEVEAAKAALTGEPA